MLANELKHAKGHEDLEEHVGLEPQRRTDLILKVVISLVY